MVINNKSWHYKWWRATYNWWGDYLPTQTNLCCYVQRIFWATLGTAILISVAVPIAVVIYYGLLTPIFFITGARPFFLWRSYERQELIDGNHIAIPYNGLQIGWAELYPYHFLLVASIIAAEYEGWKHLPLPFGIAHGLVALIVGSCFLHMLVTDSKSETVHLAKSWLSAKKQRICPLIEFKNEPTSSQE